MTSTTGPRITVITVCLNAAPVIEATLRSVLAQDYPNFEYVVVDGGSSDGTADAIRKHAGRISAFVSEPDQGVYDAMNKGVELAKGEFLLFMNAGDVFAADNILSKAAAATDGDVDVVYGDFEYSEGPRKGRVHANLDQGIANHQCILYRKALHAEYGKYLVMPGFTAADYLFLMHMRESGRVRFRKLDFVFAQVDPNGMSAGPQTFFQVNLLDGLLQRRGPYEIALRIVLHPVYDFLRGLVRRLR
jgi:glycosyltransferase involved in cell wall biosynthesis